MPHPGTNSLLGAVVITGGNTGLGYQCARFLAADGRWHVIIACRSPEKGAEAVASLIAETGHPHIEAMRLDLASLDSVRRFTDALSARSDLPLKAIVCNAGIQVVSGLTYTEDGFETTFGVNHLGHFLLVNRLLGRLVKPARIVFVASGTHDPAQRTGMPAPWDVDARALAHPAPAPAPAESGRRRYTTSKLCNVLCTYELARRLETEGLSTPASPITVNAFDPGLMPGSGLARDYGPLQRLAWRFVMPVLRFAVRNVNTMEASGRALARLILDPELAGQSGRYYEGMRAIRSSEASYEEAVARELWEASAALVVLRPDETPLSVGTPAGT